jgi:hypothetical protein
MIEEFPVVRTGRQGRPSLLDNPDFVKQLAQDYAEGRSRKDMAEAYNCTLWNITQWRKDPRVRAHTLKFMEERTVRVVSKTDAILEGRLSQPEKLSVKELLEIRKEFRGGIADPGAAAKADDRTVQEAMDAIDAEAASTLMNGLDAVADAAIKARDDQA